VHTSDFPNGAVRGQLVNGPLAHGSSLHRAAAPDGFSAATAASYRSR
jgi:hypothetical protein